MLLKKQEKDNIIKVMYDSSNILASIYNKETSDLTIIFNKGTQYKYPKVTKTDYTRFELAESQGKVFNTHIKSYSFEKLDTIDPATILTEVKDLKYAETNALSLGLSGKIIREMKQIIQSFEDDGKPLDIKRLQELQSKITIYGTNTNK